MQWINLNCNSTTTHNFLILNIRFLLICILHNTIIITSHLTHLMLQNKISDSKLEATKRKTVLISLFYISFSFVRFRGRVKSCSSFYKTSMTMADFRENIWANIFLLFVERTKLLSWSVWLLIAALQLNHIEMRNLFWKVIWFETTQSGATT